LSSDIPFYLSAVRRIIEAIEEEGEGEEGGVGDFQEGKHTKVMCKDVQDDYYSAVSDDDDDDGDGRECVEDEDEGTGEYFGSRQQSISSKAKSNQSRDRNKSNSSCSSDSNNKHNSGGSSSSCTVDSKNNSNSGEHVQNNCGTVVQVIENDMLSNNAGRAGDVYRSLRQR
jgi:hypothetical protein